MKAIWVLTAVVAVLLVAGVYFLSGNKTDTSSTSTRAVTETSNPTASETTQPEQETTQSTQQETAKTYNIEIRDFAYNPETLTIKKGDKVVWTNKDSARHTVTSDSGSELNSRLLGDGESYEKVFNNQGTYEYYCKPHPYMKARIIVE